MDGVARLWVLEQAEGDAVRDPNPNTPTPTPTPRSLTFGSLSRLKETPCVRWTSGVKGTGERGGLAAMALDLVGVRVRARARARVRVRVRGRGRGRGRG